MMIHKFCVEDEQIVELREALSWRFLFGAVLAKLLCKDYEKRHHLSRAFADAIAESYPSGGWGDE